MSREDLRCRFLDTVKEVISAQQKFLQLEFNEINSEDEEIRRQAEDTFRGYIYLINLRDFLEKEKYDPFTSYSEKYPAGMYPGIPDGKTFWELDDTAIGIIEKDLKRLVWDVVGHLFKTQTDCVGISLDPTVIRNDYISIIERCIYEDKQKKKDKQEVEETD